MVARERHARASALFVAALDLDPRERRAWLESECGGDVELLREVESLLASDLRAEGMLDAPPLGGRLPMTEILGERGANDPIERAPERVGRFRVRGLLGRGGMGVVYVAEQDHPARTVALKLLRADSFSVARLRRFELEAEILGRLRHRGIAQVFDAGTADTETGPRPFIALELVRGEPLLEFGARLDLRGKLELLRELCDAVQHAHQHGVIHRDLKPANVLVDETGQPKVLDFGVARADFDAATAATSPGELVGTLAYMSPEQLAGDGAVDTRADVHALGVIGFELIAGRLPYDAQSESWAAVARAIREDEPRRLGSLDRRWRGDLETLFAKALEKDRERRYATAAELGADLGRLLRDEPIAARAPSTVYRLAKFARRNRVPVAGVAATLLALVLGVAGTTWKALEARERRLAAAVLETREAEQRRNADLVLNLMERMLRLADPAKAGRNATWLDATHAVLAELDALGPLSPALEANVRGRAGQTLNNNGLAEEALPQLAIAAELAAAVLPPSSPERLKIEHWFAQALASFDRHGLVLALLERIWRERVAAAHELDPQALSALVDYAAALSGAGRDAEAVWRMELAAEELCDQLGLEADATALAFNNLGTVYSVQLEHLRALDAYATALAGYESLASASVLDLVRTRTNVGSSLTTVGRIDEAAAILRACTELAASELGPEHPETTRARMALAGNAYTAGDAALAERELRECLDVFARRTAVDPNQYAFAVALLAQVLAQTGRNEEGFELVRGAIPIAERRLGRRHYETLRLKLGFVRTLVQRNELAQAETTVRELLVDAERALGQRALFVASARAQLGDALCRQGRFDEAVALLTPALDALDDDGEPARGDRSFLHSVLGLALEAQGDPHGAALHLERAVELAEDAYGPGNAFTQQCALHLERVRDPSARD